MKKWLLTICLAVTFMLSFANTPNKEYYDNGTVKKEILKTKEETFILITYYENGKTQEIGYFNSDSQKIGTWTRFNEDGCKIAEANFKNDKKHGLWKMWDDCERLIIVLEYKNGKRLNAFMWSQQHGLLASLDK